MKKKTSIFPIELDEIWDGAVEVGWSCWLVSWWYFFSVESDEKTKKNDDLMGFNGI